MNKHQQAMRFFLCFLAIVFFKATSYSQAEPKSDGRAPYSYDSLTESMVGHFLAEVDTVGLQGDEEVSEDEEMVSDEPMFPAVVSDSIYIARLQRLHSVMDLPFNSIVRSYIKLYTEKKRDKAESILGLSEYYFPLFEQILDQYGMPLEFKYLAVIESALNPRAVSRAGATGLWQFMYTTGRMYGLKITSTVDERRDPIAATHAAARHLRDLYNTFNDWTLAMAAYNCGAGNVNKAMRRSGRNDFWGIYSYLPRETRGYVPAFIGATYMMNYSAEHNLPTPRYDFSKYDDYDTVRVAQWMHFDQIAAVLGISKELLRDLNPQYRRDIVPGNEQTYTLKLPTQYINSYISNEASIAQHRAAEYNPKTLLAPAEFMAYVPSGKAKVVHKVKNGDTLSTIASRYGVRVQDLRHWNALRSNSIRVGQKLNVFVNPNKADLYTGKDEAKPKQIQKNGFLYYQVKQGDTLWSISNQYKYLGITTSDLKSLNNMTSTSKIMPGQTIKIKKIG